MLDLIAEAEAEQIFVGHKRALETLSVHPQGVQDGELTLRPTSAYGFQAARRRHVGLSHSGPPVWPLQVHGRSSLSARCLSNGSWSLQAA